MIARPSIGDLGRDDRSGCTATDAITTGARRLHRNRHGNISILFLAMGLVFYCVGAMVWNTGRVTDAKIRAQTAADAAAYSAAVWNSRAVNNITAANMLLVRHASSVAIAKTVMATYAYLVINIVTQLNAAIAGGGATLGAAFVAWLNANLVELVLATYFMGTAVPPALEVMASAPLKFLALSAYQAGWVIALPDLIDKQRQQLEAYFDCDIRLNSWDPWFQQPQGRGAGPDKGALGIVAPLRLGTPASSYFPFRSRFTGVPWIPLPIKILTGKGAGDNLWPSTKISAAELVRFFQSTPQYRLLRYVLGVFGVDKAALDAWIDDAFNTPAGRFGFGVLKLIKKLAPPSAKLFWWGAASLQVKPHIHAFRILPHWVIASQRGPLEFGPHSQAGGGPKPFTVVATAIVDNRSSVGLAAGVLGRAIAPDDMIVAYAQAETYNGADGLLDAAPAIGQVVASSYPWRVWTTQGQHWQPRLTRGDLVADAIAGDPHLRAIHNLDPTDVSDVRRVTKH